MAKSPPNSTAAKMGRPVTIGATVLVGVKFPPSQVERVDAWAKVEKVGRSGAIRQLVDLGLGKRPKTKPANRRQISR